MSRFIAGIDEAGRGPVIGPLVVSLAFCRRADEKKLNKLCRKDSKQLSSKQREEILPVLKEFVTFKVHEITAKDINSFMEKQSLNDIEAKAMADLAKTLKDSDVMIDLPDSHSSIFARRMEKFGLKRFEAQHKADENYPIVAAASIQAKVLRDAKIEEIKKHTGIDFGSGYPSDPKTRKALVNKEALKALHGYIRNKWKTLETVKQKKLFEHEA
jgi:ribonuclease HII